MNELDEIYSEYVGRRIVIPSNLDTLKKVKLVKDYADLLDEMQKKLNSKLNDLRNENENFEELKNYAESLIRKYHNEYGYQIK
jgi:trans-2-enoyl-CoA reductase